MFEYRVLNDSIKYQQQWLAQGYTVALTADWYDFKKSMTIAEYTQQLLTIVQTNIKLKQAMLEKNWCMKKRKISKKKYRYWFLFKTDSHLSMAVIHTNITLVNSN